MAKKNVHIVDLQTADKVTGEEYLVLQDAQGIEYALVGKLESTPVFTPGQYYVKQDGNYVALDEIPENWSEMYQTTYIRNTPDTKKAKIKDALCEAVSGEIQGLKTTVQENADALQQNIIKTTENTEAINLLTENDRLQDDTLQDIIAAQKNSIGQSGTGMNAEIFNNYSKNKACGRYSHSEGGGTIANGDCSHAEGFESIAGTKGYEIIAVDTKTKTVTLNSAGNLSEGCEISVYDEIWNPKLYSVATVKSQNSVANSIVVEMLGQYDFSSYFTVGSTVVNMHFDYAFSEGATSVVGGKYAHAEGDNTKAIAKGSHSEGFRTTANGEYSHAEGSLTQTLKDYAHAEGDNTKARGIASHSEGNSSIANGTYSHAEGYSSKTGIYGCTVISTDETAQSAVLKTVGNLAVGTEIGAYQNSYGIVKSIGSIKTIDKDTKTVTFNLASGVTFSNAIFEGAVLVDVSTFTDSDDTESIVGGNDGAHAEGKNTKAIGTGSHAEGNTTAANGTSSHAEGNGSIAGGASAHAEGVATKAMGEGSHAENGSTQANGGYSHSEGWATKANGRYSHTEGYCTIASSESQHVQGRYNIADEENKYAHIVGNGTESKRKNIHTVDWNGNSWYQGKILVGGTSAEDANEIATVEYANLSGTDNLAGSVSFLPLKSDGKTIDDTDLASIDITPQSVIHKFRTKHGRRSGVDREFTYIESMTGISSTNGVLSQQLPVIGEFVDDSEDYLYMYYYLVSYYKNYDGFNTKNPVDLKDLGVTTFNLATGVHCEGERNIILGNSSHVEGLGNLVFGKWAHAEGNRTAAIAEMSHSEGNATVASGNCSHSEGMYSKSTGPYSHSEGNEVVASGTQSHAEGYKTVASGLSAHAENQDTKATGSMSHAEGLSTTASGKASHSEGRSTVAGGEYAHAEGYGTKASGRYQHVEGTHNIEDTKNKYLHIAGNGAEGDDIGRSNAYTLDWNGNGWYQGNIKVGGSSYDDVNAKEVATTEYVDAVVANNMASDDSLTLIGSTPLTLNSAIPKLVLKSTQECSYIIQSATLCDFNTVSVTYENTVKNDSDFIEIKSTGGDQWFSVYAQFKIDGLIAGSEYSLAIDTQGVPLDSSQHITAGYYCIYNPSMELIGEPISPDNSEIYSSTFTPTTTSIYVRMYTGDSATYVSGSSILRINNIYLNKGTGSRYTDIINLSGSFIGETAFANISAGTDITTIPSCKAYSKAIEDPNKILSGKTVVCFGDSLFGMYRGDTSTPAYIAESTGATVYNVGFGGCRMAQHPTTGYNEFCMYALAKAIHDNDWTKQDAAVSSGVDYFTDQLSTLKGIDFSKVDIAVIHYGTNDFGGSVEIGKDSPSTNTETLCGAMRYSIEQLLSKYPNLRIFVSLPVFRFWTADDGVQYSDSYKNVNQNTLVEFVEAIREVCKEYNLPCIDGYYNLGINKINAATFLDDGTHHNNAGRKRFGEFIGAKLISQ